MMTTDQSQARWSQLEPGCPKQRRLDPPPADPDPRAGRSAQIALVDYEPDKVGLGYRNGSRCTHE